MKKIISAMLAMILLINLTGCLGIGEHIHMSKERKELEKQYYMAIKTANAVDVDELLTLYPELNVNKCYDSFIVENSSIFNAFKSPEPNYTVESKRKVIKVLLEHGADPNYIITDGLTFTDYYAYSGDYDTFELFLKYGADPNYIDKDGKSVLHHALFGSDELLGLKKIKLLLKYGAEIKPDTLSKSYERTDNILGLKFISQKMKEKGMSPGLSETLNAALIDDWDKVDTAINSESYVPDKYEFELLFSLILGYGKPETFELFKKKYLKEGSEYNKYISIRDINLINTAAKYGNLEMVKYCIEKLSIDKDVIDMWHNPLVYAAEYNQTEIVKYLCDIGAKVTYRSDSLRNLDYLSVDYAVINGNLEMLDILMKKVEGQGERLSELSINYAFDRVSLKMSDEQIEIVKYFAQKGYDFSYVSLYDMDLKYIKLFFECGRKLMPSDLGDCLDSCDKIEFLISQGADLNQKGYNGEYEFNDGEITEPEESNSTVFEWAVMDGNIDIVKFFVEHGADVNYIDDTELKESILQTATSSTKEVFTYLIDQGADVNYKDTKGKSVKQFAIENKRKDMAKVIDDLNKK